MRADQRRRRHARSHPARSSGRELVSLAPGAMARVRASEDLLADPETTAFVCGFPREQDDDDTLDVLLGVRGYMTQHNTSTLALTPDEARELGEALLRRAQLVEDENRKTGVA